MTKNISIAEAEAAAIISDPVAQAWAVHQNRPDITPKSISGLGAYNAHGQGVKYDTGKLQWSLLPLAYLRGVVRVLMFGAAKYSPHNWRQGMPHTQTYNATMRHLDAWMAGEDLDPETGLHHVDHALCELVFLRGHITDHTHLDDRYRSPLPADVKAFLDGREDAPCVL